MKKLIAMLLVVVLIAGILDGCGKSKVQLTILPTAYAEEDYAIAFAKENTELQTKVNDALNALIDDGTAGAIIAKYIEGKDSGLTFQTNVAADAPTLTMGTNAEFPPYEFYEGDKIVGIDAEIAAAIADKLGMKLVIEDMAFDAIIPAVTSGKIDMGMAGMTVTDERKQSVNFSDSYATGVQVVIVTADSKIKSVDDLSAGGLKIGVQSSTTGDLYATWDLEDEGLATVQRYNKGADAVQALVTGKVDCVIIDNEPAKAFVEANNG